MFNNNMMITAACGCNIGKRRKNNEDNFYFAGSYLDTDNNALSRTLTVTRALSEGCCVAVFDGMGGEDYGEVAANTAAVGLSAALAQMNESGKTRAEFLYNTAQKLNDAVFKKTIELGAERVGCTMSALLFERREFYLCSVGDSRAYRLRAGELEQLSTDDVVADYRGGGKAPLTQHIGMDPENYVIEPHIGRGELKPGDIYLICSDGLTDMLDEGEILAHLEDCEDVKTCVESLIAAALENGGRDNVTVILARIEKGRPGWKAEDELQITDRTDEEAVTEKTERPRGEADRGAKKKKKSSFWLRLLVVAVSVLLGCAVGKHIGRSYLESRASAKTQVSTTQISAPQINTAQASAKNADYKPAPEAPEDQSAEDEEMYAAWAAVNDRIAASLAAEEIDYLAPDSFEEFSAQFEELGEEFVFNKNFNADGDPNYQNTWERSPEWREAYNHNDGSTSHAIKIGICDVDTKPDDSSVLRLANVFYTQYSDGRNEIRVGTSYDYDEHTAEGDSALKKIVPACYLELDGKTESEVYAILGINEEMLEWLASRENGSISSNNECSVSVGDTGMEFMNDLTDDAAGQTNKMIFRFSFSDPDGACRPCLMIIREKQ